MGILVTFTLLILLLAHVITTRPNIVFILIDDLGFNDVSFHGSTGVNTPNITALARDGMILTRHYSQSICTPSRGALMTSKYPMRLGLQRSYLQPSNPWGVSLQEKFMPQYFKDIGYECHAVGKWHLGFYRTEYLPTRRGFDTFYGFYGGSIDYYDHSKTYKDSSSGAKFRGLDFRHDNTTHTEILRYSTGIYSTYLYAQHARKLIQERDKSKPLFLYLSHQGVHNPLQAPHFLEKEIPGVSDPKRREYLAQLLAVDRAIGVTVETLKEEDIFDDTLIVVTSDNGGVGDGVSSNYPLRGAKHYNFEGGVRSPALARGPQIEPGKTYDNLFHLVDWLPTLFDAAGGDVTLLSRDLDGVSHWNSWLRTASNPVSSKNMENPPRTEVLINVQSGTGQESAIIRNNFKLYDAPDGLHKEHHSLDFIWDQWYFYQGPKGDTDRFRVNKIDDWSLPLTYCRKPENCSTCNLRPGHDSLCLFDVISDPCEYNNIAKTNPEVVDYLRERLEYYRQYSLPPFPLISDPESNPHGGAWGPWNGGDRLIEI